MLTAAKKTFVHSRVPAQRVVAAPGVLGLVPPVAEVVVVRSVAPLTR